MSEPKIPVPLKKFASRIDQLLKSGEKEEEFLPLIGEAISELVAQDDWLDDSLAQPHPEYYQQYLLYADPGDRFSIVSFVWGPGQSTPVHDHTVWGVIGMLRGEEYAQNYKVMADGMPVPEGPEQILHPGDVDFVSPAIGDVHKVRNGLDDRVSISIHAYGGNIGQVKRHVFPVEGGPARDFISGYSN